MWETPRFRNRAYAAAITRLKRIKRAARKQAALPSLRIRRAPALLSLNDGGDVPVTILPANVILNEFGPSSIALFTDRELAVGQPVSLRVDYPRPFFISGRVAACRIFQLNPRVFARHPMPYRIKIEFTFLNHGEIEAVKHYCEELEQTVLKGAA